MTRLLSLLFVVAAGMAASVSSPWPLSAQGPQTLVLTPSSGDPAGTLVTISGSGWCVPNTGAVLTGA
ncbi:MAG TPA: hypothetical protein PJ994_08785, partial [Tepidiformaceae bacterium]|nr:hypothetical protein [Tepidiformaceae bacterium]